MSIRTGIVEFAVQRRWVVTGAMIALAVLLVAVTALPSLWPKAFRFLNPLKVDTDPENMLPADESVRVFHNRMKHDLRLHDLVVVGVVNEQHPDGVFNPESLSRIYELTRYIESQLYWPDPEQPHRYEGIVRADLIAPSTVDNIEQAGPGTIRFETLMKAPPLKAEDARAVRRKAERIPFLKNTLVSEDGKAICLYLPLTRKDLSHRVYTALNERIPVLWLWGPAALRVRRMQVPEDRQDLREALERLGRLAAHQAEDRARFRGTLATLEQLVFGGHAPAGLGAVQKAAEQWRPAADKLDAETKRLREAIEQRADMDEQEKKARLAELAARRAAEAGAALRSALQRGGAGTRDDFWFRFARWHLRSIARSQLPAAEQCKAIEDFAARAAIALRGAEELRGAAPSPQFSEAARDGDAPFPGPDRFHITGLPVAEDTFGVEMFVQMAVSAPVAMAVIFLLMWLFFRKLVLILSPMIVAFVSVIVAMGLLVVTGNTVHIMSSMIPIFIVPIAVLDAVHILSEFFDRYQQTRDRRRTITAVMDELFMPMLYTSLTTAVGFGSLALTPIPPVQVFGLFVALGVMAAWVLTITFIPAFVMFIPDKALANFGAGAKRRTRKRPALMSRLLAAVGRGTFRYAKLAVPAIAVLVVFSLLGIWRIRINDNPVKWFAPGHPIRVADRELNRHFGGTYMAYLALQYDPGEFAANDYAAALAARAAGRRARFEQVAVRLPSLVGQAATRPAVTGGADAREKAEALLDEVDKAIRTGTRASADDLELAAWTAAREVLNAAWEQLDETDDAAVPAPAAFAAALRARFTEAFGRTAAVLGELKALAEAVARQFQPPAAGQEAGGAERFRRAQRHFLDRLGERVAQARAAAAEAERPAWDQASALLADEAQHYEVFKRPETLEYVRTLQGALQRTENVGKSNSLADIVATVHRELLSGQPADYRIPNTKKMVANCITQFEGSNRPGDLDHFVTRGDYQRSSIWVQLRSGDNRDMAAVERAIDQFLAEHPPPSGITARWFGLTYINVVWQEKMVSGMLGAFLGSFVVVFLMMAVLYRSALWGLLSMIPLTVTIGVIYGAVGWFGKDYDMPVAVLSSLSLGLAVDYAIHFLSRSRAMYERHGCSWAQASGPVFGEPARAITRNVIVVGVGFLPLLLAALVPYQTVGLFIAAILVLAGAASLLLLPMLITLLARWLFPQTERRALLCKCGTCLITGIAAATAITINVVQFARIGWTVPAIVKLVVIVLLAAGCWLLSRREKCLVAQPEDAGGEQDPHKDDGKENREES
jgi:predicted RND superfamily exporter protein